MKKFDTAEEAQAHVDELNKDDPEWFCPIIKDKCRKDCVCYEKAYTYTRGIQKSEYQVVVIPSCTHSMTKDFECRM